MDEPGPSSLEARNEAFRRLGRNLYLFQLIEHQLKHLVAHASLEGRPHELPAAIATNSKKAGKASLGTLADRFSSEVLGEEKGDRGMPNDANKDWFSFTFRIESDEQFVQQRKKELRRLVKERNKLVHTAAADIRPDDTDKWVRLGVFLDVQRAELVAEHEKLRLVIKNFFELAHHSFQVLESQLPDAEIKSPEASD